MIFLAPWALAIGGVAAAGAVLLHLVARQRPAAYLLPTARFIPDRRTLVSRVSRRPRDLPLLLLRLLLILSAAAAFARPVLAPRRAPRARILLIDRSAAVASDAGLSARARTMLADGVPTRVVAFDTTAAPLGEGAAALDSLGHLPPARVVGSLSAALAAARRLGAVEGARADSVELVLLSPVSAAELDRAVDSLRAQWPGTMTLVRVSARRDSAARWPLERALKADDVLAPALAAMPVARIARAVRIVRGAADVGDSAFARAGGAVVRWDSIGARRALPAAVAMGDDVVVASLATDSLGAEVARGSVLARWSDGSPAAREEELGGGCLRRVAIGIPVAGDLPLRRDFQRIVSGLAGPCAGATPVVAVPADSAAVARLTGRGPLAAGADLAGGAERPAPIASWLLGVALACALLELALRARGREEAA